MRRAPLLALALFASACGHSPATRFLTLDPVPPASGAVRADYRGPPVALAAVRLPAAVDRTEFVREDGAGGIAISDFDRWIAPPGTLMRDALAGDLVGRLPEGRVLPPAAVTPAGATRVEVAVLALDAANGRMRVAYRIVPPAGVPVERVADLSAPSGGEATLAAGAVTAMLGLLADRVAAELPDAPLPRDAIRR